MSDRTEALLKEVRAELARIGDGVKRTAEDAFKQAKQAGDVSAETKAKADELLAKQTLLADGQTKLAAKLESLESRGKDADAEIRRLQDVRGGTAQRPKSMGHQVAQSDALKAYIANGAAGKLRIGVQMAITSDPGAPGSAGDLIAPQRESGIVQLPRRTMTIRQLLFQGRTTSNLVEYPRQTVRTNAAAPVAEAAQKPESNLIWDLADAPVRTIAHFVKVSRQALDDASQLQTEIDSELRYGLDLVEEAQLLKGSGVGQNLAGLATLATAYAAAFVPASPTMIDTLRLAVLQASLAEFPATGIVLHPTDWARVELLKDGENRYLWSNPRGTNAPGLWGLPVVETQSQDIDEFLVGAFLTAATIYDRMDAEVLLSSEDSDNFQKNMYTIRAEKRLALAVKRPAALVTGDFGFVA